MTRALVVTAIAAVTTAVAISAGGAQIAGDRVLALDQQNQP